MYSNFKNIKKNKIVIFSKKFRKRCKKYPAASIEELKGLFHKRLNIKMTLTEIEFLVSEINNKKIRYCLIEISKTKKGKKNKLYFTYLTKKDVKNNKKLSNDIMFVKSFQKNYLIFGSKFINFCKEDDKKALKNLKKYLKRKKLRNVLDNFHLLIKLIKDDKVKGIFIRKVDFISTEYFEKNLKKDYSLIKNFYIY